ncbi:BgTH12-06755 [Blumeria graminis f. sp. triticale]|uniref:BgTH12-06755 n=1 Tax=Blumeria graminis f. sp. triticale TaxID=1689686 RepID=A0A9W4CY79_BLUGR|nr:BgTH12-06755 [Blumeria graminis f. sp. triticale]
MKFLSIATMALFVVMSASIHITDEGQIFSNGARRPVLNSNFRMSCLQNSIYDETEITDFAAKAYQELERSVSNLDRHKFDPFPNELLYAYHIGRSQMSTFGEYQHYIIINFVGNFFAGFSCYNTRNGWATTLCRFVEGTQFYSPASYRRLYLATLLRVALNLINMIHILVGPNRGFCSGY